MSSRETALSDVEWQQHRPRVRDASAIYARVSPDLTMRATSTRDLVTISSMSYA